MTNVIPIRRDIRTDDEAPGACELQWIETKQREREIKRAEQTYEERMAKSWPRKAGAL